MITFTLSGQIWKYNGTSGTGIESPTNFALGDFSTAMGNLTNASGNYSTTIGYETSASGTYSIAMGRETNAIGNYARAMGFETTASGYISAAMGQGTLASGAVSQAMGAFTTASGFIAAAMGQETIASGSVSMAMGRGTLASGTYSTAMGYETVAEGYGTTAIGIANSLDPSATATSFDPLNRAFVIGNGSSINRSDAMTVLYNGNTTIAGSVTAPSFIGSGAGLTNLPAAGLKKLNEGNGDGWRLAAQNPNNYGSIGFNAVDLSISPGSNSTYGATGDNSIAMGYRTEASGETSTAMGYLSQARGSYSTATGFITQATEDFSTAMGNATIASGENSTAIGYGATASGGSSTAIGLFTTAAGYGTTAIGIYNTLNPPANAMFFNLANRAFVIGNGSNGSNRSDALTILFDGTTTIAGNVTAPSFVGDGSGLTNLPVVGLGQKNEGNGNGWRLATQDPANYGNIGANAVDLSTSGFASSTNGATGESSTAFGKNTTASGESSTAIGNLTIASGDFSTAIGRTTTASQSFSMATGNKTTASGNYSTAMGQESTASGEFSLASGYQATASGDHSTAAGRQTSAAGFGTTAIGANNTIDGNAIPTSFDLNNRAFVIGNGLDIVNRSDAMTVLFDGTTTIAGSVTASSFIGDGAGLTNLPAAGLEQMDEGNGNGWRLAGQDLANYGNIGKNAIDLSISGFPSPTRGATGENSTALGENTTASGISSTAIGYLTVASGVYSTAMGSKSEAQGSFSTSIGVFANALGDHSTAMGQETIAEGYGTTAIGNFNTRYEKSIPDTFDPSNRAFVIGNGTDGSNRSDAMTVYFDGTTTLAGDLTVHSDKRLKLNIQSLGSTLALLQQIDGKTYQLKTDQSKQKIGLLAQDVQNVFPELVRKSADEQETLSVNYQGLIPVLINAVNEQQDVIESQQNQINKLTDILKKLLEED